MLRWLLMSNDFDAFGDDQKSGGDGWWVVNPRLPLLFLGLR